MEVRRHSPAFRSTYKGGILDKKAKNVVQTFFENTRGVYSSKPDFKVGKEFELSMPEALDVVFEALLKGGTELKRVLKLKEHAIAPRLITPSMNGEIKYSKQSFIKKLRD